MSDVIGRYARLSLAAERLSRAGRPVPLSIMREIQQIEATAQTRLTPRQIAAAMQHVHHAKAQILQQETSREQANAAEQRKEQTEHMSRDLTRDWFNHPEGLTPDQFLAVRDGKKVKFAAGKKPSAAELDRISIERTKSLDPKGKGFTFKEWEERLDELADTDPLNFDEKARQYRVDPKQLRNATKRWRMERVGVGLQRRHEERNGKATDEEVESESHQRKAQLIDAIAENFDSSENGHGRDFDENERVREVIEEGEGQVGSVARRADVARAFLQVEARESEGASDEQS